MKKAQYKRCKMGCLPGDLPKRHKIAMLEHKEPIKVFPWQTINGNAAKSFRKDHHKKANRKFRRSQHKEIRNAQLD